MTNREFGEPITLDETSNSTFVERRISPGQRKTPGLERRQFTNSYSELSPEASELGQAVDAYKLENHRRFINYEELLAIIHSLGYHKSE